MSAALSTDAASETYADVQEKLDKLSYAFVRQYGGNYEDVRADANLYYLRASELYNPGQGSFEQWVCHRVWLNLLEVVRVQAKRNARLPRSAVELGTLADRRFDMVEFLDELSDDARTVVRLLFVGNRDVALAEIQRGGLKPKPHQTRNAIREYLRDVGWGAGRILESFQEIRKALG